MEPRISIKAACNCIVQNPWSTKKLPNFLRLNNILAPANDKAVKKLVVIFLGPIASFVLGDLSISFYFFYSYSAFILNLRSFIAHFCLVLFR